MRRTELAAVLAGLGPDEVRPGAVALVVVLALVAATALLLRSFTRQLKKIDFDEEPDGGTRRAPDEPDTPPRPAEDG